MLQLVAYVPDGVRRFPLHADELVIGSETRCDVCLPYTGVAHRHARLVRQAGRLHIEDLGSRKGVLVSGRRVREALLEVLDEIRLGAVTLLLEDVATEVAEGPPEPPPQARPRLDPEGMLAHLARLSDWVLADAESRTTLEFLVVELLRDLGGGVLLLVQGAGDDSGVKFIVASSGAFLSGGEEIAFQIHERLAEAGEVHDGLAFEGSLAGAPAWIGCHRHRALERTYTLMVGLPGFDASAWNPLPALRALGDLLILGLVHHVGHYEPILPGKQARRGLQLDPGFVMGESEAVRALLEQLRTAVDPPVKVLLQGEPGSGRELLARSLHASGERRNGPFIAASCGGARLEQVEADLFGAEVAGREGPVRRLGKLILADGGTLFLRDVEELPLELQARLVRFLRSGEVEPSGSTSSTTVDVRLIASCREPLDSLVARDRVRVDLAYRLSQIAIRVPPLRERREELPLLIQSLVNRLCHETGKRVQGIAVKALSALFEYDYPGNLPELESIVRQMVHLCPAGKPIDVNLLPSRVRVSPIRAAARIDEATDLALERLVADTERSAIREALRRSRGNKTQAARDLGLSRNGLAMKMERLDLEV